jgi:hypothetical protein
MKQHGLATSPERRYLLLTAGEWIKGVILASATASTVALFTFAIDISPWIPVTVFITALTVWHMVYSCRFILPFPHIAILMSALQYVFAPWLSFYYPSNNRTFEIGGRLPEYLAFVGPVMLAVCGGWSLGLIRLPVSRPEQARPDNGLLAELDIIVLIGFLAFVVGRLLQVPELAFALHVLANLRYIGVFGRILVRGNGWWWRLVVILSIETLAASGSAMFHDLVYWSGWTAAILMYRFRPPLWLTVSGLVAVVIALPAVQFAKTNLRIKASAEKPAETLQDEIDRTVGLARDFASGITQLADEDFGDGFLADMAHRYNQGGIINRVMLTVPEQEPFAEGRTLKEATFASLVPRFADPDKLQAGGRENMLRYASVDLTESTSMNLGYAGEMYANFGGVGGVVASGIYVLVLALAFRPFCKRAANSALWWVFIPLVAFPAIKADEGIAEILNAIVKSALIAFLVYQLFPSLRRALNSPALAFPGPSSLLRPAARQSRWRYAGN